MKSIAYFVKRILEESTLTPKQLKELVHEKEEELKGLISQQGALYVIGKELGLDFNDSGMESVPIKDLQNNQYSNVSVSGTIKSIRDVHTFNKRDGSEGRVGNIVLEDDTGRINVVMWGDKTDIYNNPNFEKGAEVSITDGRTKWSDYRDEYEFVISNKGKIVIRK